MLSTGRGTLSDLNTALDTLEAIVGSNGVRLSTPIRYYRFTKKPDGGYIFKTFLDYKDGHSHEFRGSGATRMEAVTACLENIQNNVPSFPPSRDHKSG